MRESEIERRAMLNQILAPKVKNSEFNIKLHELLKMIYFSARKDSSVDREYFSDEMMEKLKGGEEDFEYGIIEA